MCKVRFVKAVAILAVVVLSQRPPSSQPVEPDRQMKAAFDRLRQELAEAQRQENEAEVRRLAAEGQRLLGDLAGVPEVADEYRPVPADVPRLTVEEARKGFEPYLKLMQQRRW